MKLATVLSIAATLIVASAQVTQAATLRPSGKYSFMAFDSCEAKFSFTTQSYRLANGNTDTAVRIINSDLNGHLGAGAGYIKFTQTTATGGKFSLTVTEVNASTLRINNSGPIVATENKKFSGHIYFYRYDDDSRAEQRSNDELRDVLWCAQRKWGAW